MTPTLRHGQDILSINWFMQPKAGDIVVIKKNGIEMVKRIEKVEDGKVFVVGDNLRESTDSRHFGLINLDQIIGKVIFSSENHPECNEGSLNLFQISLTFVRDVSPPKADQHDSKAVNIHQICHI